ncbi:major facilitator superfamily transporter sugar protein [Neofusicoccum parvum]|uniref:Major facilitator superfamily transporter sugar protein n=1 Tax=Neofusicoccum parvum TaxID=310453 RepID=A0ACB5SH94_9PEZI|nr:major facilitator superfamily transporter sugar protein [Neofusicoccum parvum]
MSSYFSNLLTTTTSRYNSLRRNLLDNEADGDTEDDTHISRVLRAYYQEKGRPFPPWLPPDPRAPSPAPTQQFVRSTGPAAGQAPPSRGGLSDLWDPPASQTPPPQPGSLRSRAPPRGGAGAGRGGFLQPEPSQGGGGGGAGRPLPSQRAGSYQSSFSQGRPSFDSQPPSSAGSGSAQDRLKARLWGSGRSGSPGPTGSGSSSPAGSPGIQMAGGRDPFERSISANPSGRWAGGSHDEGSGGGGGSGSGSGRGRIGLPSGPRAYR